MKGEPEFISSMRALLEPAKACGFRAGELTIEQGVSARWFREMCEASPA